MKEITTIITSEMNRYFKLKSLAFDAADQPDLQAWATNAGWQTSRSTAGAAKASSIRNCNMSEASTAVPQHVQTETPSTSKPPNLLKTTYLVLYNFVSAVLWLTILGRVVSISSLTGSTDMVFKTTSEFTKWTQTLALLEIAHSALGESHRCISVGLRTSQVLNMFTFVERVAS